MAAKPAVPKWKTTVATWKNQYETANTPAAQIEVAFEIADEAETLIASLAKESNRRTAESDVVREMADVQQIRHRSDVRRLLRLSNLHQNIRKLPIEDLVSPPSAKQPPARWRGVTLTHLLTLTRVDSKSEQWGLFQQTRKKKWSVDRLKREIREREQDMVVRPTLLVTRLARDAQVVLDTLSRLQAAKLTDHVAKIKPIDRKTTLQQIDQSLANLKSIERSLNDVQSTLRTTQKAIEQLHKSGLPN